MFNKINKISDSILIQLEKDFHKDILESSVAVLTAPNVKTKFSNFATNIRELTRELFYTLAPDDEVKKCDWYEKETPEGKADITRLQRMIFAIKGGLSNDFIEDELNFDFENATSALNKVIQDLNKYTHINEKVYYRSDETGFEMVQKTLISLECFLKTIEDVRSIITEKLEELIYDSVSNALTDDILNEIDIIATHYWIEGAWVDEINIQGITSSYISVEVTGSVDVKHQYGSDGDFRRGDGVHYENSYPLSLSLILDVDDPLEISINTDDINIDNSNFFE
ncbi:hypothetical protein SAMN04487786_1078 [Paenisporosarcina quisquiliarum]|nr:hypothetical protein SAMN04487786_1078 [Paenisporosarcina quisquiliarum]